MQEGLTAGSLFYDNSSGEFLEKLTWSTNCFKEDLWKLRSNKCHNFSLSSFKGKSKGDIRLYRADSAWFPFAWHLGWLEWAQPTLAGLNQCQTVDHHHFPEKTLSSRTRLVLRFPPWLWSLAGVIWPAAANRSLKTLRSVWSSSWWACRFYELCFLGWCLGWRFTALTACSAAPRHE